MKRILCIVSSMNAGGAETFLMKIYRKIDKNKFQMDFCVNENHNVYEKEILKMGGRLYIIPSKSKDPIAYVKQLYGVVKNNNYKSVLRIGANSLMTIDLLIAKFSGASRLVLRSSNANSSSFMLNFLHKIFFFLPRMVPNVKLAPSDKAGEYTFGKKQWERGDVIFLPNALDVDEYRFNLDDRDRIRREFGIEDKFVIGHVGRFEEQKNHSYLIDIFNEYRKQNNSSVLLLVGIGGLEEKIKSKVQKMGLTPFVIFAGLRSDVSSLYSAMDIFLFPSLYEGMPNTVIEAQTSGLRCFVSDTITKQVNVIGNVFFYGIEQPASVWVENIEKKRKELDINRCEMADKMSGSGYSIEDCVDVFENKIIL